MTAENRESSNSLKPGKKTLFELAKTISGGITEIRHKIHSYPEMMFMEHKTASIVREYLSGLDVEVFQPYIETDTVGVIRGKKGGKTVLLRADIDALNLEEKTSVPWQSCRRGYAHACGHDGHTAMLLGAVDILSRLKDFFSGNVKFVFQPAEEEGGGGKVLVEKGVLEDEPSVDEVYALHGWPGVEEGCFESCPGTMMAAVDNFSVVVKGRGGHAAMPHLSVDPVFTAAQVVTALQGIVSRNIDPDETAVVSVCSINGGDLNNVIPDTVAMKGTVRYVRKEMQGFFRTRIEEVVKGICCSGNAEYEFRYIPSYIPLVNSPEKTELLGKVFSAFFGEKCWSSSAPATTGGEDFSFFLDRKPGVFYRLGMGREYPSLHNSKFDFNDNVIEKGIVSLCAAALGALETPWLSDT